MASPMHRFRAASFPKRAIALIAALLVAVSVAAVVNLALQRATHRTLTAYFPQTTGLYKGSPVKVIGVNVGKVDEITPRDGDVKVVMHVDKSTPIPADARAVIVAQSLVSGRFVQLTPVYSTGPEMADGADIPMERTAVPVDWDDVKKQLTQLSDALGPKSGTQGGAADLIDTAADNLDGNGAAIARSISEMSDVMGTISDNRDDLFATVRSLQKLTGLLSQNHEQLVEFNGRMASVSDVLAGSDTELGDAMTNLDEAVGDLQGFLNKNDAAVSGTMSRLAQFTGTLKKKDEGLRGLLHSAPNQLANFYNIYNPLTASLDGVFGLGMGNNLITLLCGSLASTDRPMDTDHEVEKCVDLMAPIIKDLAVNFPPFMSNPVIGRTATQDMITYQNDDVRDRAQAGVKDRDVASTKPIAEDPLTKMLLPFGGGH
ncbi:MAG: MCE family protein [Gordonia sp. (in: high G+C Gram-positive bacteria)]|uniref:MCE family protein n=1 Tax=Gordonia sp. (in: high G+C Gram-positive bacteria) TaxID=84139 RepID=UPI0039E416D5